MLLSRVAERMRREVGVSPREFASSVAAIVGEDLASGTAIKRLTPMIAIKEGAGEPLLDAVLALLESTIDFTRWQQIAPNGYIASDDFMSSIGELGLAGLRFAQAA